MKLKYVSEHVSWKKTQVTSTRSSLDACVLFVSGRGTVIDSTVHYIQLHITFPVLYQYLRRQHDCMLDRKAFYSISEICFLIWQPAKRTRNSELFTFRKSRLL